LQRPWLRREALVLAACFGFGLLVLPALIFLVGGQLLGEYRPGAGMAAFYADLYTQLAAMSPWPWLLVLGPWLAVQLLRALWLPFASLMRRTAPGSVEDEDREADESAETII
jgi:hypothetical protein